MSDEPAPNPTNRDHTLLEELVWSAALIGGVVSYIVLVAQFATYAAARADSSRLHAARLERADRIGEFWSNPGIRVERREALMLEATQVILSE